MYQGRGHCHNSSTQNAQRFWRLGKVETIIQGKDKNVRGATIKVVSPNGKLTVINRPLSRLYLFFKLLVEELLLLLMNYDMLYIG